MNNGIISRAQEFANGPMKSLEKNPKVAGDAMLNFYKTAVEARANKNLMDAMLKSERKQDYTQVAQQQTGSFENTSVNNLSNDGVNDIKRIVSGNSDEREAITTDIRQNMRVQSEIFKQQNFGYSQAQQVQQTPQANEEQQR